METLKVVENQLGRPCGFCREKLVETVMELFWAQGYNGLSLNAVAKKMNMSRSSLYNSFQSKQQLFLECLDYYADISPAARLSAVQPGDHIGTVLYEVFDGLCEVRGRDLLHRGCFAVNAYHELANQPSELGQALQARSEAKKQRMYRLINHAVAQGELPNTTDIAAFSHVILSYMNGLNTHAKTGASVAEMKAMCHLFLAQMGFKLPQYSA